MIWFVVVIGVFLVAFGLAVAAIVWWFKPFFKGGVRNDELRTTKETRQELRRNLDRIARARNERG